MQLRSQLRSSHPRSKSATKFNRWPTGMYTKLLPLVSHNVFPSCLLLSCYSWKPRGTLDSSEPKFAQTTLLITRRASAHYRVEKRLYQEIAVSILGRMLKTPSLYRRQQARFVHQTSGGQPSQFKYSSSANSGPTYVGHSPSLS
jgi:hypothetical protein